MLIVMKHNATPQEVEGAVSTIHAMGVPGSSHARPPAHGDRPGGE